MKKAAYKRTQIINALKEHEQGRSMEDVCHELRINKSTFINWLDTFGTNDMQASEGNEEPAQTDNLSKGKRTDFTILRTKIHKPPIRREYVIRQTLIQRLETGKHLPLTLVSAATGCGKSIMTSQWLEHYNHRHGWLSLDTEYNNVNVLIAYLVAILKEQWPEKSFDLETLMQGANLPSNLIASTLINDLDQLDGFFVLVLDDYQTINDDKVHEIINGLLQYPPEHFHLVILTQRDPPLKLAKLRAQLRMNEVRMKDLAFTKEEVVELSSKLGTKITADQIHRFIKHTDGWITAITAGLIALSDGVDFERVVQSTHNPSSVISELLDEVVLQGMSIATQKFLALSVLLDRFSIELLDTMVAAIDDEDLTGLESKEFLILSKRRNLFLIPLDINGEWYRYHHFFRNQIQNRISSHLTKNIVLKAYKAASLWFEKENYLEEAQKYAILSEDMTFAVNLFDRVRNELFNSEQFQRLERLLELFPSDTRQSRLELSISLAMLQDHKGQFSEMESHISRASMLLENTPRQLQDSQLRKLRGEFHSVRSFLPYISGDFEQSIIESKKSLNLLPAGQHNYFREFAIAYYAFSKQAQGKVSESFMLMDQNLRNLSVSEPYFRGRLMHLEAIVFGMESDAKNMYESALRLNSLVKPQSFPGAWMTGIYYLASSSYIKNELENVHEFHQELWKYRYVGRPFWVVHNLFIMALTSAALGQWDKVRDTVKECLDISSELNIMHLKEMVHAFEVEMALRQNNIKAAIELSALANFEPHPPIFYFYYPQLTSVKLFLRTDKKEKGIELLNSLIDLGKKRNNVNLLIQALGLQAIMYANESEHIPAKEALNKALDLSKDKGIIRTYLDFGDPMHQLLRTLDKDKPEDPQIKELLQAFEKETDLSFNKHQPKTGNSVYQLNKLSDREVEILILVSKGYKNLEIAEKLFISLDTVKKHLYNAYQKLYVKNRIGAIKKIQELGLIEGE